MPSWTINVTASELNWAQVQLGKRLDLRDGNGEPRDATPAELKARTMFLLKDDLQGVERGEQVAAIQAQLGNITVTPFDPT